MQATKAHKIRRHRKESFKAPKVKKCAERYIFSRIQDLACALAYTRYFSEEDQKNKSRIVKLISPSPTHFRDLDDTRNFSDDDEDQIHVDHLISSLLKHNDQYKHGPSDEQLAEKFRNLNRDCSEMTAKNIFGVANRIIASLNTCVEKTNLNKKGQIKLYDTGEPHRGNPLSQIRNMGITSKQDWIDFITNKKCLEDHLHPLSYALSMRGRPGTFLLGDPIIPDTRYYQSSYRRNATPEKSTPNQANNSQFRIYTGQGLTTEFKDLIPLKEFGLTIV